jgi:hypothetical protein
MGVDDIAVSCVDPMVRVVAAAGCSLTAAHTGEDRLWRASGVGAIAAIQVDEAVASRLVELIRLDVSGELDGGTDLL